MQLRKGYWEIAYREGEDGDWTLVKNPKGGWAADPFLFAHHGVIYLFAEIMSYRTGRGYIGYCRYEGGGFGSWEPAIKEKWHLSYPNVFAWMGKIYMLPEQYQSGEIALYECVDFPSGWKRLAPLAKNGQYVDSTILFREDKAWLFTLCMNPEKHSEGEFLRAELFSEKELGKFEVIDEAGGLYRRPGGQFLTRNDKVYRVAQNCEGGYGRGLVFYSVERCDGGGYRETECRRADVKVIGSVKGNGYWGIHTYNECNGLEVIDLKKMIVSPQEVFFRFCRKINFLIRGNQ